MSSPTPPPGHRWGIVQLLIQRMPAPVQIFLQIPTQSLHVKPLCITIAKALVANKTLEKHGLIPILARVGVASAGALH